MIRRTYSDGEGRKLEEGLEKGLEKGIDRINKLNS